MEAAERPRRISERFAGFSDEDRARLLELLSGCPAAEAVLADLEDEVLWRNISNQFGAMSPTARRALYQHGSLDDDSADALEQIATEEPRDPADGLRLLADQNVRALRRVIRAVEELAQACAAVEWKCAGADKLRAMAETELRKWQAVTTPRGPKKNRRRQAFLDSITTIVGDAGLRLTKSEDGALARVFQICLTAAAESCPQEIRTLVFDAVDVYRKSKSSGVSMEMSRALSERVRLESRMIAQLTNGGRGPNSPSKKKRN